MLKAEGVRKSLAAARVKLPVSTIIMKLRNTSISSSGAGEETAILADGDITI
ncbi:MAG TPA: hypothetical protein VK110_07150 [Salinisphaeraceae bacterium]|nr:hypothetical protein [Salinisphaeraceae bacterium]